MYCEMSFDWSFRCFSFIEPCGYIDTTYVVKIKRISKHLLKMINCKTRTIKRLQRARESHRKTFEESEDEE